MKKGIFVFLAFLYMLGACVPVSEPQPALTPTLPPTSTATPLPTFTFAPPPPTVRPTHKPRRPTDTPTATSTAGVMISDTPSPTSAAACDHETAFVVLSAPVESVTIGDAVQVTVTVNNLGCVALGLPQYRLYIQSSGPQAAFSPEFPEPLVHYLAVGPGQSDSVEFSLIAVAEGQATLTAMVSYEVHIGYPGPAYWGATGSAQPLILTVIP